MTSATSTHQQAYNGQVLPTSKCLSRLKTAYSARNEVPKEAKEPYLRLFVSRKREMAKPVPTKAFLQPAKAAAMHMAPHAETRPPPPIPPFLLVKNLFSKKKLPEGSQTTTTCTDDYATTSVGLN